MTPGYKFAAPSCRVGEAIELNVGEGLKASSAVAFFAVGKALEAAAFSGGLGVAQPLANVQL